VFVLYIGFLGGDHNRVSLFSLAKTVKTKLLFLCVPLRTSAPSAVNVHDSLFTAEGAEVRRGTQRVAQLRGRSFAPSLRDTGRRVP
jgi:hypothetical protein